MKHSTRVLAGLFFLSLSTQITLAQAPPAPLPDSMNLQDCIAFAWKNQPLLQQAKLDEAIAERDVRIGLSGWYPQANITGNYSHYLKLPVFVLPNFTDPNAPPQIVRNGLNNTSNVLFQLDQTIFGNDLLLASRGARFVRDQSVQNTVNARIATSVTVSKAYYDILTSEQQLKILEENIARIEKQLKDARAQYDAGLVDKTDYKRATITLGNSRADLRRTAELLKFKYAQLKELMGYPGNASIKIIFDSIGMEQEMLLDTLQPLNVERRIEYQQWVTKKEIQKLNINYYKYDFLPRVNAFINYNLVYQNNDFGKLYNRSYPNSVAGLSLKLPLFQGTRRVQNLRREELLGQRLDLDLENLKSRINSQYEQAMAGYKSSLNDWKTSRENVALSAEVYATIKLQYDEGIKTYLDLMTAETDLRTSQINYLNALYNVLSSKLDVQQALGNITVN